MVWMLTDWSQELRWKSQTSYLSCGLVKMKRVIDLRWESRPNNLSCGLVKMKRAIDLRWESRPNNLSCGLVKMKRAIEHPLDQVQTKLSKKLTPALSPFC